MYILITIHIYLAKFLFLYIHVISHVKKVSEIPGGIGGIPGGKGGIPGAIGRIPGGKLGILGAILGIPGGMHQSQVGCT